MVLIQTDDLVSVEARLSEFGVRVVFVAETDEIRGLHLHPKDVPGAIVSVDAAREVAEWPWAGPIWRQKVTSSIASSICGMEVTVEDPANVARIWGHVLGVHSIDNQLHLDDSVVVFKSPMTGDRARGGISAVYLTSPDRRVQGTSRDLLGTELRFRPPA
jgi:hypothetical protein